MAKLTLEELHEIRSREQEKMKKRDIHNRAIHVIVSMGTSGIEKGAKVILNELADEIERQNVEGVIITQAGSIKKGAEPVVQIHSPKVGLVTYGNVKKSDCKNIVEKTVKGGVVINELAVTPDEE